MSFLRSSLLACTTLAVLAGIGLSPLPAQADEALTDDQKQAVRELVRDTLVEDPEILVEAMEVLKSRQEALEQAHREKAIGELMDSLNENDALPYAGAADGDVTIVEFFDYNCTYCKSVAKEVLDAVKEDGNIKLVFIDLPILGDSSDYAARAALAAAKQDKYVDFHLEMMRFRGRLTPEAVRKSAAAVGLDQDKLEADMASSEVETILQGNMALAQAVNVRGTPAFIVGDQFLPGAVSREMLMRLVEETRKEG